jgi:hypothetical protein
MHRWYAGYNTSAEMLARSQHCPFAAADAVNFMHSNDQNIGEDSKQQCAIYAGHKHATSIGQQHGPAELL